MEDSSLRLNYDCRSSSVDFRFAKYLPWWRLANTLIEAETGH
jgi:hypothetical protein